MYESMPDTFAFVHRDDPNVRAANILIQKGMFLVDRIQHGRPMSHEAATAFLGFDPRELVVRINDLLAEYPRLDRWGRIVSPRTARH